jgi:HK97 gp10 family phage protein
MSKTSYKKLQNETVLIPPVKKWLAASGLLLSNEAGELAPVDQGRLRRSITYSIRERQNIPNRYGPPDAGDGIDSKPEDLQCYVGTNVEYAPYQEYGTGKIPPQPFLSRAFELYKNDIQNLLKRYIKESLK